MKSYTSVLIALLLGGCANPLNLATYQRYTQEGDAALAAGDDVRAEAAYARAAQNVDWGALGEAAKSGSLFNLANAKIRLGKFAEAEPLLLESLRIEEKLGTTPDLVRKRVIALSIVYLEMDQIDKGLVYLKKTRPFAKDPAFASLIAKLYPGYVEKLEKLGRTSEAAEFRK